MTGVQTCALPIRSCPECRWYYDRSLTLLAVKDKQGNSLSDSAVGLRFLDFPLEVGKRWTQTTNWMSETSNRQREMKHEYEVVGFEDVTVPAGTFKAFKIMHSRRTIPKLEMRERDRGKRMLWYAPAAKTRVKREFMGTVRFGSEWELLSYSLK